MNTSGQVGRRSRSFTQRFFVSGASASQRDNDASLPVSRLEQSGGSPRVDGVENLTVENAVVGEERHAAMFGLARRRAPELYTRPPRSERVALDRGGAVRDRQLRFGASRRRVLSAGPNVWRNDATALPVGVLAKMSE